MRMLADFVGVKVERCRAIEFNAEINEARRRLEQYVVTPDIVKMFSMVRDRVLRGSREELRSLYLYSGYGKGKSYFLLALRGLFEGWGRDILLPKLPLHERQTWETLLGDKRYIVVSLDSLEHARFEDAIRYDLLEAVGKAQSQDPVLAKLPAPPSVYQEMESWVDYCRSSKPAVYEAMAASLSDMSLEELVAKLKGPRASEYHQRFIQVCISAGVSLPAVVSTREPALELVKYYQQRLQPPYQGIVFLADELGQAFDSTRVTPDDTQALARLVNWAAQAAERVNGFETKRSGF